MNIIKLGSTDIDVSSIALGCMRMQDKSLEEAKEVIQAALDIGITLFDHADMYGDGKSELIFGQAMKEMGIDRDSIFIQSKCGINRVESTFDFSKQYILDSVDGILERLGTDYLDMLLLHRPDALVEPKEVNEAFNELKASGKVRHFGVSNQSGMMIDLLKSEVEVPLVANQLQLSIMQTAMLDYGMNFNVQSAMGTDHAAGIMEYSRINKMTIQAWSPFYAGFFKAVFVDNEDYPEINAKMKELGEKYGVSTEAIAVAWIERHPAQIQTIIGSMNPDRIRRIGESYKATLTRKEWYDLYKAGGNQLL